MSTPPPRPSVHELMERLMKAQETIQQQLVDLQRAVMDTQVEATKTVGQETG